MVAILTGMSWYLTVVLIFISLIIIVASEVVLVVKNPPAN